MASNTTELDVEQVFSVKEVAKFLKVDSQTIRKFINCEVIAPNHWFYVGRLIRIKKTALDLLMNN